jgi:putative ABC transport system permease protein
MHVAASAKISWRTARHRLLAIASVVAAAALAVGVLVATFAITLSFAKTAMRASNSNLRIVWQEGATTERQSNVPRDAAARIVDRLAVGRGGKGELLVSAEIVRSIPMLDSKSGANVLATLRGVSPDILTIRPGMRVIAGRFPQPGTREVMAGRGIAARIPDLRVGSTIELSNGNWQVVGLFSSGGDVHESELMADATTVMDAFRARGFNSIAYVPSADAPDAQAETHALQDVGLQATVKTEARILEETYENITRLLNTIAYGIGTVIVVALLVGILNTFLITVRKRATELATLRALGFDRGSLIATVVIEALLCGVAGALVGLLVVRAVFERAQVSLYSGVSGSQLTFDMHVDGTLAIVALAITAVIAIVVGAIGAVQVFSVTPATALRRA